LPLPAPHPPIAFLPLSYAASRDIGVQLAELIEMGSD